MGSMIHDIVLTGKYHSSWKDLLPVLSKGLSEMLDTAHAKYPFSSVEPSTSSELFLKNKTDILNSLQEHRSAPFTLQRICELVEDYETQYKNSAKLMNALLKLVSVCSTYPPVTSCSTSEVVLSVDSQTSEQKANEIANSGISSGE